MKETKGEQILKLIEQLEQLEKQIYDLRSKLIEAQERNRKLDWLLTEAMEKLETNSR